MFLDSVIVNKDCARTDIAVISYRGIANIGQVRNFAGLTDLLVLDLNKGSRLAVSTDFRAWTQVGERPHGSM